MSRAAFGPPAQAEERHTRRARFPERPVEAQRDANDRATCQPFDCLGLSGCTRGKNISGLKHTQRQGDDRALRAHRERLAEEAPAHQHRAAPPLHALHDALQVDCHAARNQRAREPVEERPVAALRPRLRVAERAALAPLLDDGSRADELRVGGVEALHHERGERLGFLRQLPVSEQFGEGDVPRERDALHGALRLGEAVDRAQPPPLEHALLAHRIDRRDAGGSQECSRSARLAMDELGADLDRDVEPGHAAREAAAADPLARLEHQHAAAGARQRIGGGKAGRAGADYDDLRFQRR